MQANEDRPQRIVDWLAGRHPDLASMYRASLRLLAEESPPGDERVRISHICHSMREVMNRVLGVAGSSASPRIKPPSGEQVQKLPDLLTLHPALSFESESDTVLIPRDVAAVLEKLIKTAVQEKRRSRDDVASLLTDDGNVQSHAVVKWVQSRTFFTRWAHLQERTRPLQDLPTDEAIRGHVATFEELLDGVITEFFTLRRSIDDLLAEINAQVEEGTDE